MNNTYEEWKNKHQPWELKYHQQGNFRWPGREHLWDEQWDNIFKHFGELDKDTFNDDDVLVDIGCGSRPALQWFNKGIKYNIDPLLSDYLKISKLEDHWKPYTLSQLISEPAEKLQENLVNKCDFVLCWNVLDHTYDWKEILKNCYSYLKKDGIFLLGTDVGGHDHIGHPGISNRDEFLLHINSLFNITKYTRGGFKRSRTDSLILTKK